MEAQKIKDAQKIVDLKKGCFNLVDYALGEGFKVTTYVDGEAETENSKDYEALKKSLECADEVEIEILTEAGSQVGWALAVPYESDADSLADWSMTPFMNKWDKQYENLITQLEVEDD
jgi:hypothetical protein|tara:strand:- start:600 stop:953 length:354 start_codon:yes stop_codon:yes gene_type:complete